ncbi:Crp/Fnr family transcriptional regulator [Paenibacillus senegalensis]|uniref:Crp/Fnr family transcriptional regulator n=1 Tax=Paenibacillus senegalensis TaxID=1465766 RepID=UPI000287ADF6|nr:Crp/Fnr family transcriptional regulator [Paenibacillus senegalensis]
MSIQIQPRPHHQLEHFLTPSQFEMLSSLMHEHSYSKGSSLIWEGEKAEQWFYIKRGKVKVTKSTEDGRHLILFFLQEGDFFGEFAAAGNQRYSFDAAAVEDTVVGVVSHTELEALISMDGSLALHFIKWMSLMQKTTESKFRDLLLFGKKGALASTLIRLSNTYGEKVEDGILIRSKLSHTELANLIGTTRESVNRMLSNYRDEGIVSYEQGYLVIRDLAYLRSSICCPDCPVEICRL